MPYEHVFPGQPFAPRAQDWNGAMDAARAVSSGETGLRAQLLQGQASNNIVLVKNTSGADLNRFDVVDIDEAVFSADDNENGYKGGPALKATGAPVSGRLAFCGVTQEPIADGKVGRVAIAGWTVAYVKGTGRYAWPVADEKEGFETRSSGGFPVYDRGSAGDDGYAIATILLSPAGDAESSTTPPGLTTSDCHCSKSVQGRPVPRHNCADCDCLVLRWDTALPVDVVPSPATGGTWAAGPWEALSEITRFVYDVDCKFNSSVEIDGPGWTPAATEEEPDPVEIHDTYKIVVDIARDSGNVCCPEGRAYLERVNADQGIPLIEMVWCLETKCPKCQSPWHFKLSRWKNVRPGETCEFCATGFLKVRLADCISPGSGSGRYAAVTIPNLPIITSGRPAGSTFFTQDLASDPYLLSVDELPDAGVSDEYPLSDSEGVTVYVPFVETYEATFGLVTYKVSTWQGYMPRFATDTDLAWCTAPYVYLFCLCSNSGDIPTIYWEVHIGYASKNTDVPATYVGSVSWTDHSLISSLPGGKFSCGTLRSIPRFEFGVNDSVTYPPTPCPTALGPIVDQATVPDISVKLCPEGTDVQPGTSGAAGDGCGGPPDACGDEICVLKSVEMTGGGRKWVVADESSCSNDCGNDCRPNPTCHISNHPTCGDANDFGDEHRCYVPCTALAEAGTYVVVTFGPQDAGECACGTFQQQFCLNEGNGKYEATVLICGTEYAAEYYEDAGTWYVSVIGLGDPASNSNPAGPFDFLATIPPACDTLRATVTA